MIRFLVFRNTFVRNFDDARKPGNGAEIERSAVLRP